MNATSTTTRPTTKPTTKPALYFKVPINLDISEIKPSHLKMLLILETFWGQKSYCWPSNRTLAHRYGCSVSQVRQILRELEEAGYIWRLPVDPNQPGSDRAGIFAHRRLDPDRPVEDRPPPPEAVHRLWTARDNASKSRRPPAGFPTPPPVGFPAASNYSLSLNKSQAEKPDAAVAQRQREDPPTAEPIMDVPAQESTAAVHPPIDPTTEPDPEVPASESTATVHLSINPVVDLPVADSPVVVVATAEQAVPLAADTPVVPADALTAGQREFLASLSPEQRAGFDAATPAKQASLLQPHERGFDPVIRDFQVRSRELPSAAPPAPPPIPATLEELIEQLPGAPREWTQKTAEALAQAFGGKKDRQLWGEWAKIAELIRRGRIDPDPVLNALGQAMGEKIRNPGAKFWAAFKGLTGLDEGDLKAMAAGKEPSHAP